MKITVPKSREARVNLDAEQRRLYKLQRLPKRRLVNELLDGRRPRTDKDWNILLARMGLRTL